MNTEVNRGHFAPPGSVSIERANGTDIFFREGWANWRAVWGDSALSSLSRYGLIMIKPDGLAAGKLPPLRAYLEDHEFRLASARPLSLHRTTVRALWQNDWLAYSADRLAFSDFLYTASPAALILVEDISQGRPPCAYRLAELKGPALVSERRPGQIRQELGSPDRILNYVHTPDCPIEMVREIDILLSPAEQLAFLIEARDVSTPSQIEAIEAVVQCHDFDFDASLTALGLDAIGPDIRAGAKMPFSELLSRVRQNRPSFCPWDLVTVARYAIPLDYTPLLETPQASYEAACATLGLSIPAEYEAGVRETYSDAMNIRGRLDFANVEVEPAGLYAPPLPLKR